jgi:hypothetical protein
MQAIKFEFVNQPADRQDSRHRRPDYVAGDNRRGDRVTCRDAHSMSAVGSLEVDRHIRVRRLDRQFGWLRDQRLEDLASFTNPVVRGWLNSLRMRST